MQNNTRNPVSKCFGLLRWMVDEKISSVGVRSASKALGVAPSSAHRVISMLVEEGFLQRSEDGANYSLGLEAIRLAHKIAGQLPIRRVALPHMRRLVAACNEAAFLSLYDRERQKIMAIEGVETDHALRYVVELHKWKPVHVAAAGWAVMAFLPSDERLAIVAQTGLAPLTDLSVTDPQILEQELKTVRGRGYALTRGQRISGAVGLAAPLFGPSGAVIGTIGLSIPEQRFVPSSESWMARLLTECTNKITAETGGQAPSSGEDIAVEEHAMNRQEKTDHIPRVPPVR